MNRREAKKLAHPDLDAVLKIPGNELCADCGAKRPLWASINLGIIVCVECSGHHRNLGVHISKVRSLTLDKWQPEWIKTLKAIGNSLSNNFYEYQLPKDFFKPATGAEPREVENWIRNKYQHKRFVPKDCQEPHKLYESGKDPHDALPDSSSRDLLIDEPEVLPVSNGKSKSRQTKVTTKLKKGSPAFSFDGRNDPFENLQLAGENDSGVFGEYNVESSNLPLYPMGGTVTESFDPYSFYNNKNPNFRADQTIPNFQAEQLLPTTLGDVSMLNVSEAELRATKAEACKDSIGRLFTQPKQMGFGPPSYSTITPYGMNAMNGNFSLSQLTFPTTPIKSDSTNLSVKNNLETSSSTKLKTASNDGNDIDSFVNLNLLDLSNASKSAPPVKANSLGKESRASDTNSLNFLDAFLLSTEVRDSAEGA